jgi:hypothetical protein
VRYPEERGVQKRRAKKRDMAFVNREVCSKCVKKSRNVGACAWREAAAEGRSVGGEKHTMLLREALSSLTTLLAMLSLKRCNPMICSRASVCVCVRVKTSVASEWEGGRGGKEKARVRARG